MIIDVILSKTWLRRLLAVLGLIGIALCAPLLVYVVRETIIGLIEKFIMHRKLNYTAIWNQLLLDMALFGTVCSSFLLLLPLWDKKIPRWILGVGGLLMAFSLFWATRMSYVHTDNAWYAAMGRGIARGNITLENWVGDTISQYFPYAVVEAFWSIFINSYREVHALSIVTLSALLGIVIYLCAGLFLKTRALVSSTLTVMAIVIAMYPAILTDAFAHIAPLLCTLSAAYVFYRENKNEKTNILIAALLACWIDNYNIVYFIFPLALENALYYRANGKIDAKLKWVVLGMAAYAVRHIAGKFFGMIVPGSFMVINSAMTAASFDEIGSRFSGIYMTFSNLWSADFWGKTIYSAIPQLCFAAAMLFSFYLLVHHSLVVLREKSSNVNNRFMTFLITGAFLLIGIDTFSQISYSGRYSAGPFVNCLILLVYWMNTNAFAAKKSGLISIAAIILSFVYQAGQGRYSPDPLLEERQAIVDIIRAEDLHNGYAWYGNGLSTNFVLNEQRVAAISEYTNEPFPALWNIDKTIFYRKEPFDFLIAWRERSEGEWKMYDWDDDKIREFFGVPRKVIDEGRVRIYIYDDISDKVPKPPIKTNALFYGGLQ